jgi:hypothetical protein
MFIPLRRFLGVRVVLERVLLKNFPLPASPVYCPEGLSAEFKQRLSEGEKPEGLSS